MTNVIPAVGWTLLHFLWQGAVVAGLAALGLWALEGRDSRFRYALACVGLLAMMAAPAVTFCVLRESGNVVQAATVPGARPSPAPADPKDPPASPRPGFREKVDPLLPGIVLLWAAGCLAMSVRLAGGWVWLQWLRRRRDTRPAEDGEQLLLLRLCQAMGVGSNLRLLLCRSVPGPTVLGWLKPVILIPPAMVTGLTPEQLELILAHELAHVLRHDYLVNLFQSVAETLFFFHPAVWWMSRKIRQEREQASDDLVVRLRGDALDYAQALTLLQALACGTTPAKAPPRLALGAQGGDFMSRIHRLISPTAPSLVAPRAGLVALLILAGGFVLQARRPAPAIAAAEEEATVPKGGVYVRRYDRDSADGHAKAGSIDLIAQSASYGTLEEALGQIQKLPEDTATGYVTVLLTPPDPASGSCWTYKFTGVDPLRVLTIIRAQVALAPMEKKPGSVEIVRINSFTHQGGLIPRGLNVYVWAGDVPADAVLVALDELEAMTPKAGIPQDVRKVVPPGTGKGPRVILDLENVDPLQVRRQLETALAR